MDEGEWANSLNRFSNRTHVWIAFVAMPFSIVGLLFVFFSWFVISSPDVSTLKGCLVTSMAKVKLCPGTSGYTRLENISPFLKNAIIASEDAMFFNHQGFDFHEIKQSLAMNFRRGQYVRGASTITQQLAKNVFLSPEKSILRKLREAYLTFEIERQFSKNEIFERYLNVVELGEEIYGVQAAARYYFKKSPGQLNVLESAFLAFLLPNPKKYSESFRRGELSPFARKMTLLIIKRLERFNKIPPELAQLAEQRLDQFPWVGIDLTEEVAPQKFPIEAERWQAPEGSGLDSSIWNDTSDEVTDGEPTHDDTGDQEIGGPQEDP